MTKIAFRKMHGLGNDFVVLDLRQGEGMPARERIAAWTDRRTGIGCDQFIVLLPQRRPETDAYMMILNAPDASEAEACGNATRCVAMLLMDETGRDLAVVETIAGRLICTRAAGSMITVDMGVPAYGWQDIPLSHECDTLHLDMKAGPLGKAVAVNVGNPHVVFFVDDVAGVAVKDLGQRFENNPLFPKKANIEFAQVKSRNSIVMRVWERGAGETNACGSGACATNVAAVRRGLTDRSTAIYLNGGVLQIEWREADDHLLMTGPAAYVYEGTLSL